MFKFAKYLNVNFFLIFLFSFLFFSFNLVLANNSENFSNKLNKCVTCHTMSGNSIIPIWPKIAEQHYDYLIKQLIEFKKGKDGDRYDPNMFAMLQDVNDNEMIELAKYFSNQILEKSKSKIKKNALHFQNGKKIYLYGDNENNVTACVGCHGIDGYGNKLAKFPILKWQHKDYLITQLTKFKSGTRSNDFNSMMRDIVSLMSDDQINYVAEYISFLE